MDRFRMLPSYHYEDNTDGSLLKSVGKPLRDYKIEGNCFQDGVPSPDNPIEVQCCGEKTKNLLPFPYVTASTTRNGITVTVSDDGSICIDGTSTAATSFYLFSDKENLIPGLKIGDTITLSKNPNDESQGRLVWFICNYYNSSGTMKQGIACSNYLTLSGTISEEWVGVGCYIHVPVGRTLNNLILKPQIELGNTATEYEPYGYKVPVTVSNDSGEKTYNIYLNETLKKVGEYADYIDFKSGKVMRHNVVVDLSGYKWYCQYVNDTENFYYITNAPTPIFSSVYCLCNCAKKTAIGSSTSYLGIDVYESKIIRFRPDMTVYGTLEKWQDYIDNNECYVIYPLGELQEQPISLPQILTEKGTNIISVGTTLQPSTVNYQYYKGGK